MAIQGYNPHGPRTAGAEYAREHADDLPDGVEIGVKIAASARNYVITGQEYRIEGVQMRVLAGKPYASLVVDVRGQSPEWMDRVLPEGRLLLWRGVYWRVHAVNGVFVTLARHGSSSRQHGWVNFTRKGYDMVRPAVRA